MSLGVLLCLSRKCWPSGKSRSPIRPWTVPYVTPRPWRQKPYLHQVPSSTTNLGLPNPPNLLTHRLFGMKGCPHFPVLERTSVSFWEHLTVSWMPKGGGFQELQARLPLCTLHVLFHPHPGKWVISQSCTRSFWMKVISPIFLWQKDFRGSTKP